MMLNSIERRYPLPLDNVIHEHSHFAVPVSFGVSGGKNDESKMQRKKLIWRKIREKNSQLSCVSLSLFLRLPPITGARLCAADEDISRTLLIESFGITVAINVRRSPQH